MAAAGLRCVTWNVHRGKGRDGAVRPDRIMDVIRDEIAVLNPHVLALEEADGDCPPHARILDVARIEAETGLRSVHTALHLRWGADSDGFLGTILFVHPDWAVRRADVIDLPGHCHRGAIAVEIACGIQNLRLIATHLSLTQLLRAAQMRTMGQFVQRHDDIQTVLLGDLNEWRPWGGFALSRGVFGRALHGPAKATFPSGRPVLPLDRILSDRVGAVGAAQVLRSPAIARASDHCPLAATVQITTASLRTTQ